MGRQINRKPGPQKITRVYVLNETTGRWEIEKILATPAPEGVDTTPGSMVGAPWHWQVVDAMSQEDLEGRPAQFFPYVVRD